MAIRTRLLNSFLLVIIPLFIILLGSIVDNGPLFKDFKLHAHQKSIPYEMLNLGETGKVVRLLALKGQSGFEVERFDRNLRAEAMPSSKIIAPAVRDSGLPVISIATKPENLFHPDSGIAGPALTGWSICVRCTRWAITPRPMCASSDKCRRKCRKHINRRDAPMKSIGKSC